MVWSHKSITLLAELSDANTPGAVDPVHACTQQYFMIAFKRLSRFRGCRNHFEMEQPQMSRISHISM